jgi:hypothetical protein
MYNKNMRLPAWWSIVPVLSSILLVILAFSLTLLGGAGNRSDNSQYTVDLMGSDGVTKTVTYDQAVYEVTGSRPKKNMFDAVKLGVPYGHKNPIPRFLEYIVFFIMFITPAISVGYERTRSKLAHAFRVTGIIFLWSVLARSLHWYGYQSEWDDLAIFFKYGLVFLALLIEYFVLYLVCLFYEKKVQTQNTNIPSPKEWSGEPG